MAPGDGLNPFSASYPLEDWLVPGFNTLSSANTPTVKWHLLFLSRYFVTNLSSIVPRGRNLVRDLYEVDPPDVPPDFWQRLKTIADQLKKSLEIGYLLSRVFTLLPRSTRVQHCIAYNWCALDLIIRALDGHQADLELHWEREEIPGVYLEVLIEKLADDTFALGSWCATIRADLDIHCPTDDTPFEIAYETEQQEACLQQLHSDIDRT
jgi:hypothetical protein